MKTKGKGKIIMTAITGLAKLIRMLPKAQGSAGRITLGAKQLEQIASKNKETAKAIKVFTRGTENPALDIAYKAQSNYSIAGIKVRDGKKVIGQGAVSITNPGTNQAVIKYRAADGGIQANGFINASGQAKADDIAMSFARKGGQIKADVQVGDAVAHHFVGNEQKLVDVAKDLNADSLLRKYVETTRKLQQKLDAGMVDIRKGLRGETPTMVKPLDKSVMPAEFAFKKVVNQKPALWDPKLNLKIKKVNPDFAKDFKKLDYKATLEKLRKFSKEDKVEFEKLRKTLNKDGFQAYFHPDTGKIGIMKAKNLDEVAQKLKKVNTPHIEAKTTTQSKPMTPWEYLKS